MAAIPSKVCLIVCGGTVLETGDHMFITIKREADIPAWLSQMPELSLMAPELDVQLFHTGSDSDVAPEVWLKTARFIFENRASYRGFIIVSSISSIPYFSEALSRMLEHPSVSVVLTGSKLPLYLVDMPTSAGESLGVDTYAGIRANLINALQVVNENIRGVYIIFGDRLLSGEGIDLEISHASMPFVHTPDDIVGRIEFSIHLMSPLEKKLKEEEGRTMRMHDHLETSMYYTEVTPFFKNVDVEHELTRVNGAVFYLPSIFSYPEHLLEAIRRREKKIPILFCNSSSELLSDAHVAYVRELLRRDGVFFMRGKSRPKMVVAFMWALGKIRDFESIERMLDGGV